MKTLAQIDSNFDFGSLTYARVQWLPLEEPCLKIYGTPNNEKQLTRIETEEIVNFSEGIQILGRMTSGVRMRFKTTSSYIALKAILGTNETMPHMADTGISGFDLYIKEKEDERPVFKATFKPNLEGSNKHAGTVVGECYLGEEKLREVLIHFPLYNTVKDILIGIEAGAGIEEPTPYHYEAPIIFYGSSITQGGCASRPGNSYPLILSRWLNADIKNLGFSGNAKGEPEMAAYIGKRPAQLIVVDYDYNAPTLEHLKETYVPFLKVLRSYHPSVPIVMISKPDFDNAPEINAKRRQVIYEAYLQAKDKGDEHVYFINGEILFGDTERDSCTVDTYHPNDLGFMRMAESIYPVLKNRLERLPLN